jgi:hypothetical protein
MREAKEKIITEKNKKVVIEVNSISDYNELYRIANEWLPILLGYEDISMICREYPGPETTRMYTLNFQNVLRAVKFARGYLK